MKAIHVAVLGAILVVAAVVYFMLDTEGGARTAHRSADVSRPTPTAPVTEPSGDSERAEGLSVRVRVEDQDGRAVAGAELTLRGLTDQSARTGRDGGGHFDGLAPGSFDLLARKGSAVAAKSFELEESLDLGTLRIEEAVTIRGHVYGPKGDPVGGAVVSAIVSEAAGAFDFTRAIARWMQADPVAAWGRTDNDGAYELHVPRGGTFGLRAEATGYAQERLGPRTYVASVDGIDFQLGRGTVVAGLVMNTEGQPVAGARVLISDPMSVFGRRLPKMETVTDGRGAFSLTIVPAQQTMLVVRAVGYALHAEPIQMPATDLRITLDRGLQLRLRTVDARSGAPAPGVQAIVNYRGGFATGETDANGVLVVEHLPERSGPFGGQEQIFLTGGGYVPKLVDLSGREPGDRLLDAGDVALDRGGVIRGHVLDEVTRKPIAGANVRAFGGLDMQVQFLGATPTTTDAEGAFELTGVPLGAVRLLAQHPDYTTDFDLTMFVGGGQPLFPEGRTEITKDVLLAPAATLEGTVLDPGGAPVAGAAVRVESSGQEEMLKQILGFGVPEATTDSEGHFVLKGLPARGPVRIGARHRDYGAAEAVTVKPGGDPVTLSLTEPIQLSGTVVDEKGKPVEGVRVTLSRKTDSPQRQFGPRLDDGAARPVVTDTEGAFRVRGAPAGDLVVSFEHEGFRPLQREIQTTPSRAHEEMGSVVLERGPSISGVVVDREGTPVEGVVVNAFTGSQESPGRQWANDTSDAQGRFTLHGLRDAEYNLQLYRQGFYGTPAKARAGASGLRMVVRPAAELLGRVVAQGRPVSGASVRAERPGASGPMGGFLGFGRTDARGEFTLSPLPPDETFTLVIEHDAYAPARIEGVAAGGPRRDFALDPGVQIGGVVVDAGGKAVANVQLIVQAGGTSRFVTTGLDGTFTAGGLGEGPITVQIGPSSGFIRQDPIPVTPGDRKVRIVVERGESIAGVVVGESERPMQVAAIGADGEEVATTFVMPAMDRSFRLEGLPRGRYGVRVSRWNDDGTMEVVAAAEDIATGTEDLELTLPR